MKFLLDACLPARTAELLRAAGHDCVHVYDLGHGGQPDERIMARADHQDRIPISADTGFGTGAQRHLAPPRRQRPGSLATVTLANLGQITDDLKAGALVGPAAHFRSPTEPGLPAEPTGGSRRNQLPFALP